MQRRARLDPRRERSTYVRTAGALIAAGTRLGAITNAEGAYTILNVPPGNYELNVKRLGYRLLAIGSVVVN